MPEVEFTDIITSNGIIRVWHEMTLGDMVLFVVGSLILVLIIMKWIVNKIWE